MKFVLRISMDKAALGDGSEGADMVRILRNVADSIESEGETPRCFKNARDINGSIVAQYAVTPDDYA